MGIFDILFEIAEAAFGHFVDLGSRFGRYKASNFPEGWQPILAETPWWENLSEEQQNRWKSEILRSIENWEFFFPDSARDYRFEIRAASWLSVFTIKNHLKTSELRNIILHLDRENFPVKHVKASGEIRMTFKNLIPSVPGESGNENFFNSLPETFQERFEKAVAHLPKQNESLNDYFYRSFIGQNPDQLRELTRVFFG